MSIKKFFRSIWDDIKALFRGDKRVGSRLATGRVYTRNDTSDSPSRYKANATPEVTVEAKILRANGEVETFTAKGDVL
jgi:hypothetical protein